MSFFEWLGRVIMLVLAGMITLSIIGAIAAIPSGSNLPRQIGFEQDRPADPASPEPDVARPERIDAAEETAANMSTTAGSQARLAPVQPEPVDPAEWLEVIAYALLALAGLGALGIVLLWRSLAQRRRIADALEALSAAPRPSFAPPSAASPPAT